MSASAVLSAASGRPFLFSFFAPAGVDPLLKKLGATPKLAQVTPASRLEVRPAPEMVSSGIAALDRLTGGWPRGGLSELCGSASSGRTSVMLAALAQATRRGEVCALVDASDALDPASAAAAGIVMECLLWVRCGIAVVSGRLPVASPKRVSSFRFSIPRGGAARQKDFPCAGTGRGDSQNSGERPQRPDQRGLEQRRWEARLEQVLKITDLLLQSNGFGMIVLDLADVPVRSARRISLVSWFRFRRAVERTPTALLVVEQQPIAGSCSSLLVRVSGGRPPAAGRRSQVPGMKLSAVSSQLSGVQNLCKGDLSELPFGCNCQNSAPEERNMSAPGVSPGSEWEASGSRRDDTEILTLARALQRSVVNPRFSEDRLTHTELLDEFTITADLVRARLPPRNNRGSGDEDFGLGRKLAQSAASFCTRASWAAGRKQLPAVGC